MSEDSEAVERKLATAVTKAARQAAKRELREVVPRLVAAQIGVRGVPLGYLLGRLRASLLQFT